MLVMQQSNRHALLSPSPSPGSLSLQSYQRTATTPPNFTELVNHQQTPVTPAISPYSQQPYNSFGLPCSHISHIGAGTNNYSSNYYTTLTNSTYSPNHLDSSPIGSPSSSIPSPQSPQLTISENTGATSISYESPTSSTVLKYTSYLNYPQASNYMIAPPQSTDTSPSTHYSPGLSDPPCYNSSSTPGFNYSNYFTNGTSYSSAPSTLYPIQDYTHQYQNNGASSSVTHTALWSYPAALQVSQLSKVSYDSPRYKLTPERAIPLIKWFEEHKDHPYPSRQEKMLLCQSTQLTFTQVSTWFANARRRMKKAAQDEEEDCEDSEMTNE